MLVLPWVVRLDSPVCGETQPASNLGNIYSSDREIEFTDSQKNICLGYLENDFFKNNSHYFTTKMDFLTPILLSLSQLERTRKT